MSKEELAALLSGRQYGNEITKAECASAKENGLVVAYGASDDLMVLEGAICDEYDCYGGGTALVDQQGALFSREHLDDDDDIALAIWLKRKASALPIKAIWAKGDYSWQYETAIPHATFEILEDDEKYCKGIVFNLTDLPLTDTAIWK